MLKRISLFVLAMSLFAAVAFGANTVTRAQDRPEDSVHVVLPVDVIGLVSDSRCNLYTAGRSTGHVFCIPPSTAPVLLAKVPGVPTTLTVDRLRNVFVGTESGGVYLVALDGDVREVHKLAASPVGLTMDRDGTLIIATGRGRLVRVKRAAMGIN